MKSMLICLVMVGLFFVPCALAGQVYEWIDENGVKHFTNEPPPPGARIVEQEKEIPFDAEKDRQRKESDKQYLQQKQQEQPKAATSPPADDAPPPSTAVDEKARDDGNTYHQRQVQKEQRIKQEIREHGGRPEAKPLPANRPAANPTPARQGGAD